MLVYFYSAALPDLSTMSSFAYTLFYTLPIGVACLVMFFGVSALLPVSVTEWLLDYRLHLLFFILSMATYIQHFGFTQRKIALKNTTMWPYQLVDTTLWGLASAICVYYSQTPPTLFFGLYVLVLILCVYNSFGPQILISILACIGTVYYSIWMLWYVQSHAPSYLNHSLFEVERLIYQTLFADPERGLLGALFSILEIKIAPFILLNALLRTPRLRFAMTRVAYALFYRATKHARLYANIVVPLFYGIIGTSPLQNMREVGHAILIKYAKHSPFHLGIAGLKIACCVGGQIMPPFLGVALIAQVNIFQLPLVQSLMMACGMAFYFILSLLTFVYMHTYYDQAPPSSSPSSAFPPPRLLDWLECAKLLLAPLLVLLLWVWGLRAHSAACLVAVAVSIWILATGSRKKYVRLAKRWHEAGIIISTQIIFSPLLSLLLSIAIKTNLYASIFTFIEHTHPILAWIAFAAFCIFIGKNLPTLPAYVTAATLLYPVLETMPDIAFSNLLITYWLVAANSLPGYALVARSAAETLQYSTKKIIKQGALSAIGLWMIPILTLQHSALLTPLSSSMHHTVWSVSILAVFFLAWAKNILPKEPSAFQRLSKWGLLIALASPLQTLQALGLVFGLIVLLFT